MPYKASGDISLEFISNYEDRPLEYIRDNNIKEVELNVEAYIPPDLEPTDITTDLCCNLYALQNDTIRVRIENNGPGPVLPQSVTVKLYLSDDVYIDKYDYTLATQRVFVGIANGGAQVVEIPVKYPSTLSGDLFFIVDVDTEDEVYEKQNEDNNNYASGYNIHLSNEINRPWNR